MKALLHPTYFPNIAHFASMLQADAVIFEAHDNYQKQTYRNRTYIAAANGKLALNVPVNYTQKKRQLYKDVTIANIENWQLQHLKSLESAYSNSPFYEFYQDDLRPLFEIPVKFLMDFNFKCLEVILDCLQLDLVYSLSESFEKSPTNCIDHRSLVNVKSEVDLRFKPYTQVFSDKYNFLPNLSILDLLFNEGPNALAYLQMH